MLFWFCDEINILSYSLVVTNSSVNFIIYCLCSRRFRASLTNLLCRRQAAGNTSAAVTNELSADGNRRNELQTMQPFNAEQLQTTTWRPIPWRPQIMTDTRYTTTAAAMKTWKTNGVLLRNCQIHGEFTVIPSFGKHNYGRDGCGRRGHCLCPSLSNPRLDVDSIHFKSNNACCTDVLPVSYRYWVPVYRHW